MALVSSCRVSSVGRQAHGAGPEAILVRRRRPKPAGACLPEQAPQAAGRAARLRSCCLVFCGPTPTLAHVMSVSSVRRNVDLTASLTTRMNRSKFIAHRGTHPHVERLECSTRRYLPRPALGLHRAGPQAQQNSRLASGHHIATIIFAHGMLSIQLVDTVLAVARGKLAERTYALHARARSTCRAPMRSQ